MRDLANASVFANIWKSACSLITIANRDHGFTAKILKSGEYELFKPGTGYLVSTMNNPISLEEFNNGTETEFLRFISNAGKYGMLLGAWIKDEYIYIENPLWIECLTAAIETAKIYHQQAIWDCANNQEITIK